MSELLVIRDPLAGVWPWLTWYLARKTVIMNLMKHHGFLAFDFHSNVDLDPLCLVRGSEIVYFSQIPGLILILFLLLLLSHFSHVRLCGTPQTAAHQQFFFFFHQQFKTHHLFLSFLYGPQCSLCFNNPRTVSHV